MNKNWIECTWIDNRERARAKNWKQRRRISLKETHEDFIAVVRKWEMLAASKVKMSGSEKDKGKRDHKQQNFYQAHTTFPP